MLGSIGEAVGTWGGRSPSSWSSWSSRSPGSRGRPGSRTVRAPVGRRVGRFRRGQHRARPPSRAPRSPSRGATWPSAASRCRRW